MRSDDQDLAPRWLAAGTVAGLLLLALTGAPALAEEPEAPAEETEEETGFLEKQIGDNWVLSPVIFPVVSPESGFGLALGGLATFSTQPKNEELPRSTMVLFAVPSSEGFGLAHDLTGFFAGDKIRWEYELDYKDGNDNYWGVGYDIAREIGESDEDITEYERVSIELDMSLGFRIGKSLFAGLNFDVFDMDVDERSPTQEASPEFLATGDQITSVGAGVQITFDSRDVTVNAYSGWYFDFDATFYRDSIGSDQDFEIYSFDYRGYHQIKRSGRTLAWQLTGRKAEGEVPWIRKSTVGSSRDLRGYTSGRFLDDSAAWALVEYRHMTDSRLWKLGRNGFAVWGGIGFIGEDFGDFSGHDLPNFGIGYRLEIQPRRNLRLDLGAGHDEIGFYLNFNEAF